MSTIPPTLVDIVLNGIAGTGRRVRDLAVEFGLGRVILRGRATSFHVKQLAQHGLREILPDAPLINAIVVENC